MCDQIFRTIVLTTNLFNDIFLDLEKFNRSKTSDLKRSETGGDLKQSETGDPLKLSETSGKQDNDELEVNVKQTERMFSAGRRKNFFQIKDAKRRLERCVCMCFCKVPLLNCGHF